MRTDLDLGDLKRRFDKARLLALARREGSGRMACPDPACNQDPRGAARAGGTLSWDQLDELPALGARP